MSRYIMIGLAILSAGILFWGCGHKTYYEPGASDRFYTPKQIPIKPGMILKPELNVTHRVTVINAQTDGTWKLLGSFTHPWWGNLSMWTDTAVGLVTKELERRGVAIEDDLPLTLKLTVTADEKASALTGVIARECPLDTDRDGVPDYVDGCPGTPQGISVDKRGCPMDTDGDSLPDYHDCCPTLPQGFKIDNLRFREKGSGPAADAPNDICGSCEIYMISSQPADTVIGLFKNELEKQGIAVEGDACGMAKFDAPASGWSGKFKSIQSALKRKGIHLTERAPRILHLSITDASLDWNSREIGCNLNLRVVTGDGDTLDFRGTNRSIDIDDSCDGAVNKQVVAMFNDIRIRNYLAAPTGPKDSDCDGVPDPIDECPGTPLGVSVDTRGCPLDSDGDGVPDYLDKCPGTPRGAKVDNEGCWVIDEAFFDFDKRDIKPRFYPIFDEVAEVLNNNPSLRIVIEGHTDNFGTKAYNQKLSKERAEVVKRYLVKKGIQSDRLTTVGYGFSMPKASNETDADRALNRRVKLEPLPMPTK